MDAFSCPGILHCCRDVYILLSAVVFVGAVGTFGIPITTKTGWDTLVVTLALELVWSALGTETRHFGRVGNAFSGHGDVQKLHSLCGTVELIRFVSAVVGFITDQLFVDASPVFTLELLSSTARWS